MDGNIKKIKGVNMDREETFLSKLVYAINKVMKYSLLVTLIGLVIGFVISLFVDAHISTIYKILGGIIVFGAVASQFGTGNIHRDYTYNMAKSSNHATGKFDNFNKNMDESLVFALIGGIGGILVFIVGYFSEGFF